MTGFVSLCRFLAQLKQHSLGGWSTAQVLMVCLSLQSYHLRMSIESMNQSRFIPRKDYTANRLLSGLLQLASNTSLVIDETQLEQGQLDTTGTQLLVSSISFGGEKLLCFKTVLLIVSRS